jgi:hypothetical protein
MGDVSGTILGQAYAAVDGILFPPNQQLGPGASSGVFALNSVLCDGSQTNITFVPPFPNGCAAIFLSTGNYNGSDNAVPIATVVSNTLTKNGFSVIVGGGQPLTRCTLYIRPEGF